MRAKLIVPYVLLTLVTAMIGTYIITRLVTSSARERFVNQLNEASRVAADGVVRRERQHLEIMRNMAFMVGVPEAMAQKDSENLSNLLCPLMLNYRVDVLTAIDAEAREIFTLDRDPVAVDCIVVSQGSDFRSVRLVTDVLEGRNDAIGDKYAGLLKPAAGPYLFSTAPVRADAQRLVGVLMVGTRLDALLADLKSQALADVMVLDLDGQMLATTLPEPDEGYGVLALERQAVQELNTSMFRDLHLYGRDFQAIYAPLIVRQQTVGVLGVVLPSSYVVATEATSRDTISLVFAIATAAIILVGYVLSQSIARPILRLRAMSQAVAAGDLEQSTGLTRSDEIGELATAFDVMTVRLRERTAEAARLYAETVQRNVELAEINARLQSTQQQLVQSEKLAAVGQLTAGIVHDVKNPLAVIKGLAEVLLEDDNQDSETKKHLMGIRDSAAKANRIVTDLLKFARQSRLEMLYRDLRETVEASLRLTAYLARESHVQVVADIPEAPVMVTYDAQQIEQVLINLIHNAVQAMPNGGTLRVNVSQAGEAVAIAIQDTGVGIAPENLNRIFDPFFTTKPEGEGTGLGLSVSYGIVSHHRGRIDVESRVGEGTTFTILLPVDQPGSAKGQA